MQDDSKPKQDQAEELKESKPQQQQKREGSSEGKLTAGVGSAFEKRIAMLQKQQKQQRTIV